MITEEAREHQDRQKIENGIRICEESLVRAEKYERLIENKDFKDYLADLKGIAVMHEREIKLAHSMMVDAPSHPYVKTNDAGQQSVVSSREDWTNYVIRHEIQREDAIRMSEEPEKIISMAKIARDRLPYLKEKLAEMKDAGKTVES